MTPHEGKAMRTLVYKRTHDADPNEQGLFGCYGCMERVRAWEFEAVIGIGGLRPDPGSEEIAEKVNWVGIGRHEVDTHEDGYPIWAFDHFHHFGTDAPLVCEALPLLVRRMYSINVRSTTTFGPRTQEQIDEYLEQFLSCSPSAARHSRQGTTRKPGC